MIAIRSGEVLAHGDLRPYRSSPDRPIFYRDEFNLGRAICSWPEITGGLLSTNGDCRQRAVLEYHYPGPADIQGGIP